MSGTAMGLSAIPGVFLSARLLSRDRLVAAHSRAFVALHTKDARGIPNKQVLAEQRDSCTRCFGLEDDEKPRHIAEWRELNAWRRTCSERKAGWHMIC